MIRFLVVAIVALATLTAAGPAVVAMTKALTPIIVVVGLLVLVGRLVWFFTSRF